MTRASDEVIEEIKQKAGPILSRYGAKRAGLFGSVVRRKTGKKSDIDVLVEIGQDIGLLELIRIERELQEALGRRVDLVEYDAIKPLLRERILREEVRIL